MDRRGPFYPDSGSGDDPRVLVRRGGASDPDGAAVVCWLQHAARADDNPSLDLAIREANRLGLPVIALFVLRPNWPNATARHYRFMLDGLAELGPALEARGVAFALREGDEDEVARFCAGARAALLVGDENPLREPERWRQRVAREVKVPFLTVEADVVVPTALLGKEQFSARTMRPRVQRQLEWFLVPGRRVVARRRFAGSAGDGGPTLDRLAGEAGGGSAAGWTGGAKAARAALRRFVRERLSGYAERRNHPEVDGTSGLSPYLHFGQIGPREVALAVQGADAPAGDRRAFLEEFIVRRELAWNFVRFNPRYDSIEGCEAWARRTLDAHRGDEREHLYALAALEAAETHDPLWNAAQRQMMEGGWMHGYLRMYWAKKILEWSASPEEAMAHALALNDRYEMDGRDPNGYAGVAWAIGGKHDRAWGPERPVYGTVRYMSFASTSRKFDSRAYIARWGRKTTTDGSTTKDTKDTKNTKAGRVR